jgi:hypothetical protein
LKTYYLTHHEVLGDFRAYQGLTVTHDLDTMALARLLAQLSGDLVLVLDAQGGVLSAVAGPDTPAGAGAWEGRPWADTVTADSQPKVGKMLRELATTGTARRRELNHPLEGGASVPMAYHAVRLGSEGLSLAMGRNLEAQAAMQQRLLRAQQEAEASHWHAAKLADR